MHEIDGLIKKKWLTKQTTKINLYSQEEYFKHKYINGKHISVQTQCWWEKNTQVA